MNYDAKESKSKSIFPSDESFVCESSRIKPNFWINCWFGAEITRIVNIAVTLYRLRQGLHMGKACLSTKKKIILSLNLCVCFVFFFARRYVDDDDKRRREEKKQRWNTWRASSSNRYALNYNWRSHVQNGYEIIAARVGRSILANRQQKKKKRVEVGIRSRDVYLLCRWWREKRFLNRLHFILHVASISGLIEEVVGWRKKKV